MLAALSRWWLKSTTLPDATGLQGVTSLIQQAVPVEPDLL
jgi:hypothetical protein